MILLFQESRDGTCLPAIMAWIHSCIWLLPCSKGFSLGAPVFLPPEKPNISKFHFDLDRRPARADVASSLKINIVLFTNMHE